jgi:hypothetical protein
VESSRQFAVKNRVAIIAPPRHDFDSIGRSPMISQQRLVHLLQICGAALGIPAAAAGSYSAYKTFFSPEATCQSLRTSILATMERRIAPDAKHTLLRKDVTEFDKTCGDSDPDARAIFQAALQDASPPMRRAMPAASMSGASTPAASVPAASMPSGSMPAAQAPATAQVGRSEASTAPTAPMIGRSGQAIAPVPGAPVNQHDATAAVPRRQPLTIFGAPGTSERRGWVAISRKDKAEGWIVNFTGYAISQTSLPPAGTVLTAQRNVPVWSEMQAAGANDMSKLQNRIAPGSCVRVLGTRAAPVRLWAEVAPASCS